MAIKVEEYIREDESNPYKAWFDTLDATAAAKVTTAKLRMELGNLSNIKWFGGMENTRLIGARDIASISPKRGINLSFC